MYRLFKPSPTIPNAFSTAIHELLTHSADAFKISPYGDTQAMQLIQQKQFDTVLAGLESGEIKPVKDFCRFTFTQMASLCGASVTQLGQFARYDEKYGNNGETRTANGNQQLIMLAANAVNLDEFNAFLTPIKSHGRWQSTTDAWKRTVAHALFLPSLQKGKPSTEAYETMLAYLYAAGVRFDVKDICGYTALDYARVYCPRVKLDFSKLDPKNQRCADADLPNQIQVQDFWGLTLAQYSVMQGDLSQLTDLRTEGATFTSNGTQQTPLHVLCCVPLADKVAVPIAQMLMDVEAEGEFPMNQTDLNGFYPIHNAAAFGLPGVFNYLLSLQYGDKPLSAQLTELTDSQGRNVAHDVCMNGAASEENSIIITGTILKTAGVEPFLTADKYGVPPIVYAYVCRPYLVNIIVGALKLDVASMERYVETMLSSRAIDAVLPTIENLLNVVKLIEQPVDIAFLALAEARRLIPASGAPATEPSHCAVM